MDITHRVSSRSLKLRPSFDGKWLSVLAKSWKLHNPVCDLLTLGLSVGYQSQLLPHQISGQNLKNCKTFIKTHIRCSWSLLTKTNTHTHWHGQKHILYLFICLFAVRIDYFISSMCDGVRAALLCWVHCETYKEQNISAWANFKRVINYKNSPNNSFFKLQKMTLSATVHWVLCSGN